MGWFDSQIQERERADAVRMSDAVSGLAEALTGSRGEAAAAEHATADAMADVLAYLGARPAPVPVGVSGLAEVIEMQVRPLGIMFREVALTPGWSREAAGPMLATLEDGRPVALIPSGARGYVWRDRASGRVVRVGRDDMAGLSRRAMLFYRPLPSRALTRRDIYLFLLAAVGRRDWTLVALAAAASAAAGLALPALTEFVFGPLLASASAHYLLAPVFALLLCTVCAQALIASVRALLMGRVGTTAAVSLISALMMRVLQLPAPFFKRHAAGDLASRLLSLQNMVEALKESLLAVGLTALFSLIYIVQILVMAPALALPALAATVASLAACALVARGRARQVSERLRWRVQRSGRELSLIGGIQKVRLAGAEARAFATWADVYKYEVGAAYVRYLDHAALMAVSLAGVVAVYVAAAGAGASVAEFMAFAAAYGMVTAALALVSDAAVRGLTAAPYLDLIEPILAAEPETRERRHAVGRLSGGIELDRVTFSYGEDLPPVLADLSLKIRPRQYVGIVGRTGCGKSTLMRLLLGFEEPTTGAVYYDGRDVTSLDVRSLRRNIGVVLQDDKLFAGSIYENIVVSAPWLTVDEAWAAAELAGIADDIRAMPMGMQTVVGEGAGGISGGQRQRIMIARAVAARPRILMFDEATSALDNVTQAAVAEALAGLSCTRIVIAHRLSTVRHCDRILVLDGGRIAEDGTYDELLAARGIFAELVARQRV